MAKYAVISNFVVINLVEAESDFATANGWVYAPNASIGHLYQGDSFIPAPQAVQVPESVSAFQAKAALLNAGLLSSFETLMAAPETLEILKLAWQYAPVFLRNSPAVLSMTNLAGLTVSQVDELFISASNIAV